MARSSLPGLSVSELPVSKNKRRKFEHTSSDAVELVSDSDHVGAAADTSPFRTVDNTVRLPRRRKGSSASKSPSNARHESDVDSKAARRQASESPDELSLASAVGHKSSAAHRNILSTIDIHSLRSPKSAGRSYDLVGINLPGEGRFYPSPNLKLKHNRFLQKYEIWEGAEAVSFDSSPTSLDPRKVIKIFPEEDGTKLRVVGSKQETQGNLLDIEFASSEDLEHLVMQLSEASNIKPLRGLTG